MPEQFSINANVLPTRVMNYLHACQVCVSPHRVHTMSHSTALFGNVEIAAPVRLAITAIVVGGCCDWNANLFLKLPTVQNTFLLLRSTLFPQGSHFSQLIKFHYFQVSQHFLCIFKEKTSGCIMVPFK